MSHFKNDDLYYTDTDSIFTDKELDSKLVGSELGKFKVEHFYKEVVFLGPKMYAGTTTSSKKPYICKIKGFKDAKKISLDLMKLLLLEGMDTKLSHKKWSRNVSKSEIMIKDTLYKLAISNSKRDFIYKDGIAVGTMPFKIINNNAPSVK